MKERSIAWKENPQQSGEDFVRHLKNDSLYIGFMQAKNDIESLYRCPGTNSRTQVYHPLTEKDELVKAQNTLREQNKLVAIKH